jgi:hypothetical protein
MIPYQKRMSAYIQRVLAKILLCRTPILKRHVYECPECGSRCRVYNSCTDRHGPQCSGARRATWMDKTRALFLSGVVYFQVVFTSGLRRRVRSGKLKLDGPLAQLPTPRRAHALHGPTTPAASSDTIVE